MCGHPSRRGFLRTTGLVGATAAAAAAIGLRTARAVEQPTATVTPGAWRPDPDSPRFTLAVMPDTQYMFDGASIQPEPVDASLRYLLDTGHPDHARVGRLRRLRPARLPIPNLRAARKSRTPSSSASGRRGR